MSPPPNRQKDRDMIEELTNEELCASGWAGWVGGTLYKATDPNAPLEDVMQALATEAKSKQRTVAVIDDTETHYRVIGWGYTPQGYQDTPNGPKLWLLCIEGCAKFRP